MHESQLLFLGRKAEQLSSLIETQIAPVFDDLGIEIPIRSCSVMAVVSLLDAASAADVAKQLGQSHQLVMQKLPALLRKKLLQENADPNDRRRKVYRLTKSGRSQVALLAAQSELIEQAYSQLNDELGLDLYETLQAAIAALEKKPLALRIEQLR